MVKCPYCGFSNEDGALFCEQCKSDISGVVPAATPPAPPSPAPEAIPSAEVHHGHEGPIMAAVIEEDVAVMPVAPMMIPEAGANAAEVVHVEEVVPVEVVEPPAHHSPAEHAPAAHPPAEHPPAAHEHAPAAAAPLAAAAAVSAPAATPAAAPAKPAAAASAPIPAGATPKLVVMRGLKVNEEYNIFAGENFIGRADDKPVDIDLTFQEPEDRVWTSRQHALLVFDDATGMLTVEDLNSANGTFVNRERVYPGQPKQLSVGSTLQVGTVHMRVKV